MLKIIDVNVWSYINNNFKINQCAIVGYPVFVEVEIIETNWLYLAELNNSWEDIKNNYINWNEVKNI